MANESTLVGEFCCSVDKVKFNNQILEKDSNLITVFDRHKITVPSFDTNAQIESYSAFAKQFRFTEEEVFLDFAKGFVKNAPAIDVFGLRLIFFPQALKGIYVYTATLEAGTWVLPDKGGWMDKREILN